MIRKNGSIIEKILERLTNIETVNLIKIAFISFTPLSSAALRTMIAVPQSYLKLLLHFRSYHDKKIKYSKTTDSKIINLRITVCIVFNLLLIYPVFASAASTTY